MRSEGKGVREKLIEITVPKLGLGITSLCCSTPTNLTESITA